jgi:hypothetical protein
VFSGGEFVVQARPAPLVAPGKTSTSKVTSLTPAGALSGVLFTGGDVRLDLDPATGASRYGCRPLPAPTLAAFGSSTASTISETAYAAAEALRERFALAPPDLQDRLARLEMARLRFELIHLCGLGDLPGLDVVFAPSGTDLHLIAADLFGDRLCGQAVAILPDPAETGSGVPQALSGRHFAASTPTGAKVVAGGGVEGLAPLETVTVAVRETNGEARPALAIDAEVESLASQLIAQGRRVLLVLVDGSKTGLIAPSPACALRLKRAAPHAVDVLVDACQFRLAPATLRAYLDHQFLVAVTGSKFLTGPTFSGALFVPPALSARLAKHGTCAGLAEYCAAVEWPADWAGAAGLGSGFNLGLMLRWEAALAELRAFRRLSDADVARAFDRFGAGVQARMAEAPAFEPMPLPDLSDRFEGVAHWDTAPTIFPFLLRHVRHGQAAEPFNRDETLRVYAALRTPLSSRADGALTREQLTLPVELGQPVNLGVRDGVPISALRICASARLAVEALSGGEAAINVRVRDALAKTAEIAWRVSNGAAL